MNYVRNLFGVLFGVLLLGAVFSAINAIDKLSISKDEERWEPVCDLPVDTFYAYIRIARTYARGEQVANLWKDLYVDDDLAAAKWIINYAQHNDSELYKSFNRALQENFGLNIPTTNEQDYDIKLTIRHVKESCGDYKRRIVFSERFKDMLQFLGLATLLGGVAYLAGQAAIKLRR